jgi:hypothetical protein
MDISPSCVKSMHDMSAAGSVKCSWPRGKCSFSNCEEEEEEEEEEKPCVTQ